jgi:HEAT repeat protein
MQNSQRENIDWNALANRLDAFANPNSEGSGSDVARAALEEIIGPENLRAAVDHYVSRAPGAELARSVLWQIHPWSAMQRCHELFLTSLDLDVRRSAIELLRVVADKRALPWISDYLADPDPRIQVWGAGIIDQLLYSGLIELEDCEPLLQTMAAHANPKILEQYEALMDVVSASQSG